MRQPSDKMRELRRRSFWRWGSRSAGSRRPSWLLPTSQNSGPDLLTAFRRRDGPAQSAPAAVARPRKVPKGSLRPACSLRPMVPQRPSLIRSSIG